MKEDEDIYQIAKEITTILNGKTFSSNEEFCEKATNIIYNRMKKLFTDNNECGIWCPNCGAHLFVNSERNYNYGRRN